MMLAGKTVFITGSSRGIGKAMALRCAKDGANVVIAAKTVDPHPKLEGTIHTAANEVEEAGGKSLAVQLDLRDEANIKEAIDKTVERFGGLDVLINNASAISLTTVEDTPMKRYDLMHNINVRGTFAMSKYAIPHLLKSTNPHILILSPPIELKDQWFQNSTAYTMSKYGMSLCMYGLAAQLRGQVAVNSLWPKTSIWTAAMSMLSGDVARKMSRKPSIMSDAAHCIITKPVSHASGQFLIDEEVLRENGVKDFDQYAEEPGNNLLPDFFLPDRLLKDFSKEDIENIMNASERAGAKPSPATEKSGSSPNQTDDTGPVGKIFASASLAISEDIKNDINAVLHFVISGENWSLCSKRDGPFTVTKGVPDKSDVTLTLDEETFLKVAKGETKSTAAFMMGKLKVKGNMGVALKVEKLFGTIKAKL